MPVPGRGQVRLAAAAHVGAYLDEHPNEKADQKQRTNNVGEGHTQQDGDGDTAPPGLSARSPTALSSACIAPCSMSTSGCKVARSGTRLSRRCRPTSMPIWSPNNTKRSHHGRAMKGRTPQRVLKDGPPKKENAKIKPTTKAA